MQNVFFKCLQQQVRSTACFVINHFLFLSASEQEARVWQPLFFWERC